MTIARAGVDATLSQLADARQSLGLFNAPPGMGSPLKQYTYTGTMFDVAGDASGAASNAIALLTPPADAVGVEFWQNTGIAADDYIFWATNAGSLNSAGADLAAKVTANLAASQFATAGQPAVVPFVTKGTVPSTLRFANSKTSPRVQGRWISESSLNFPYRLATNVPWVRTGANDAALLTASATFFPAGTKAAVIQLCGSGVARVRFDGTAASATVGRILGPGRYFLDEDRMGISLAAVSIYLPTGLNGAGNALVLG